MKVNKRGEGEEVVCSSQGTPKWVIPLNENCLVQKHLLFDTRGQGEILVPDVILGTLSICMTSNVNQVKHALMEFINMKNSKYSLFTMIEAHQGSFQIGAR